MPWAKTSIPETFCVLASGHPNGEHAGAVPSDDPPLHPLQIFRLFDSGRMSREDFQQAMACLAREVIEEMEEDHLNPIQAYYEQMLNRRTAFRLSRKHGEPLVREVLLALAEVPDFKPARWLWNAAHRHVPLHCFFRCRREPVFRITHLDAMPQLVHATVEHGGAEKEQSIREVFTFRRDRQSRLYYEVRRVVRD